MLAQSKSINPGQTASANHDPIKVMVVDDAVVVRGLITRWVNEQPDMTLAGHAVNGKLALDKIKTVDPDVVILDVEMPEMDGITALPQLLKAKPSLIVIMASTLTQRNADISLRALTLGARDYIPKPDSNHGVTTSVTFRTDLIDKIRALAGKQKGIKPRPAATPSSSATGQATTNKPNLTSIAGKPAPSPNSAAGMAKLRRPNPRPAKMLAIGSSTGGPQALIEVMSKIASDMAEFPILIAQHMPATFTPILADHLKRATGLNAKEGEHGEPLRRGTIYVAPGGKHMLVERQGMTPVIALNDGPPVNFCKPAVDPMFKSIASVFGGSALGLILTGMGNDGAQGSVVLADAGANILVQDEASSVVWGMPGATYEAGAACQVLPLTQVPQKIVSFMRGSVR